MLDNVESFNTKPKVLPHTIVSEHIFEIKYT